MSIQLTPDRLLIRKETAGVLEAAIEGHRQGLPIDPATLSRYVRCDCANALEVVVLMIQHLPEDRAALIASAVEDAYEDAHGGDVEPWDVALDEEARADADEDVVQYMARTGRPDALHAYVVASRQQETRGRRARRAITRYLRTMPTPTVSAWTTARKEAVGS